MDDGALPTATAGSDLELRPVGRPREFEDCDVFRATTGLLVREGYAALTLAAIAKEVGYTRPALSQRFGNRQGLFEAYIAWTAKTVEQRFRQMRAAQHSPLETLRSLWFLRGEGDRDEIVGDPTNYMVFFASAWEDPRYWTTLRVLSEDFYRIVSELLRESVRIGELRECDTERLTNVINLAMTGAIVHRHRREHLPLVDLLQMTFDDVLAPYVTTLPGNTV